MHLERKGSVSQLLNLQSVHANGIHLTSDPKTINRILKTLFIYKHNFLVIIFVFKTGSLFAGLYLIYA